MRALAALLGAIGIVICAGALTADPAGRTACERTHTPATCMHILRG